jgi:hypothetical protein
MSKLFQVSKDVTVVCNSGKTRNGFKHTCTLYVNGQERESAKINYLNRTWESFDFESTLLRLADSLPDDQKHLLKDYISNYSGHDDSMLRTTAMVAKMGEIFGKDKKESNDWKKRMLKAGLPEHDIPDDWDSLSEDEKERRLNLVIEEARK